MKDLILLKTFVQIITTQNQPLRKVKGLILSVDLILVQVSTIWWTL